MKRLPMFLDGTWNDPDDNTNVWRSKLLVSDRDADGNDQVAYYGTGVGTKRFERIRGGALGVGLNANIEHAYQWLMERYEPEDEIYIFGFSRGAFTARSLAGMISKCGLLLPGSAFSVPQLFERYRRGTAAPALYDLEQGRPSPDEWTDEDRMLKEQSLRIPIEFIGVWDTVGALGIPFAKLRWLGRKSYEFHNTTPSNLYKHMYHALAIDENRAPYQAALWTLFQPPDGPPPALKPGQVMEQRWFIGAHCNVGGGYRNDPLAQIPLAWMQSKAAAAGLRFKREIVLNGDEHLTAPADSYASFLHGAYRLAKRRHFRPIGRDPVETKKIPGTSWSINEEIDATVFERWRARSEYRPENLVEWAKRKSLDPDDVPGAWPQ